MQIGLHGGEGHRGACGSVGLYSGHRESDKVHLGGNVGGRRVVKSGLQAFLGVIGEEGVRGPPAAVPRALLKWIVQPVEDDSLGSKILSELAVKSLVLGYNC